MDDDNFLTILSVYRYRVCWLISSIMLMVIAHYMSPKIIPNGAKPLDIFGYWGTVATIIALIVSVLEIMQSAKISKTITYSINKKIDSITIINKTALLSESSGIIDEIIDSIDADRFRESTLLMRELQKKLLYSQSDLLQNEITYLGKKVSFAILEHKIEAYRASNTSAPVTKLQKGFVKGALINLKQAINDNNPGRR